MYRSLRLPASRRRSTVSCASKWSASSTGSTLGSRLEGCDAPFKYVNHAVSDRQLIAHYLAADVALVTPLRDGMNLVAKEFVVVHPAGEGHGALVLTEFAGCAAELTDAIMCNLYDADSTSKAIEEAWTSTTNRANDGSALWPALAPPTMSPAAPTASCAQPRGTGQAHDSMQPSAAEHSSSTLLRLCRPNQRA